ncbi:uncharacterized protein DS421_2g43530 [Arachis hypogaea]|nr:uncharacterized protein DS421_2g43530 [Arachis hypogaea]
MDAGRRRLSHALGHIGKNDVIRVINPAGDPSRPLHIPLPNDLLLKSSRHVYLTVSDGVRRTYKIGCSPNVLGEITLEGGGKGFIHKGLDDFDVRIFESPGVERSYVLSGGESAIEEPPRSAAAFEVGQTFRSDYPFFVMHMTRRLLGVHFLGVSLFERPTADTGASEDATMAPSQEAGGIREAVQHQR